MKLFINTVQPKKAIVSLIDKGKIVLQKEADSPLPAIEKLLKERKLKLQDLKEIESHPGPGSFTGLKISATTVNTLNFALRRKKKLINPNYE